VKSNREFYWVFSKQSPQLSLKSSQSCTNKRVRWKETHGTLQITTNSRMYISSIQ